LDQLLAKAPGLNYGVAVTFAYPNHQFNRFYMYGTVGDQTPPTPRTLFGIASITKTFTATLFANGVSMRPDCFDWDAGLTRYLDRLHSPGPTQEPLGIAVLVNGFWNKDKSAVLADNHGHSMLKQISAAIWPAIAHPNE
jgi:CubicO group peptidase (beta-lactamase class C family)